jgi:hypothetical protein
LEDRRLLSLTPAVNYSVAASPVDLVAGDFDGDSVPDLATISATQLSLLLGNSDGTFGSAQTMSAGSGPRALAAVDMDADGRLDLVTTSNTTTQSGGAISSEGFIDILLNGGVDGSGNVVFQPARSFSTGVNTVPGAIAVGDLNGDGKLDVAAGQDGGTNVMVLLGNGDGTLQGRRDAALGGANPGAVAMGDVDGDGKLDLVTANRWSGNVSLLLNAGNDGDGNVTFQPARNTAVYGSVESAAVGDFDSDGQLDLAVTSSLSYYGYYYGASGYVNVLLGNGDGTFAAAKTTLANNTPLGEVALADFNGDGNLDAVTPDGLGQPMAVDPTVLLGRGDGTFDPPYHFDGGYGPIAVVAADLNGDTAPDVAVANVSSWNVSVFLNDQDWPALGTPFVSIGDVFLTEGNTGTMAAEFTVSLSAAFSLPMSVRYSTADGTATAGSDYQAASGTLTFQPGGPLEQTVNVLVNGDRLAESFWYGEHFFVNLSDPHNVRIDDGQGTATIADNEPIISINNVEVAEGNAGVTNAVLTVTLSAAVTSAVSIDWSTADYSAIAGSDYQAASGTLTFNPGAPLTQTVSVAVYGDRIGEYYAEGFNVRLGNGYSGYASIRDDEPLVSIADRPQYEGNSGTSNMVFTLTLSQAYDQAVSVNFSTAEGDTEAWTGWGYYGYYAAPPAATSDSDFQAANATVTFAPGQTQTTLSVAVMGDRLSEADEYFSVNLSRDSANAALADAHAVGIIVNDEPAAVVDSGTGVLEGNGGTVNAVFTVRLSATANEPVSVAWSTANGSAAAGSDYAASSGTLTFAPGVLTQGVSVPVIGDRLAEYSEYFYINLSNGTLGYGSILDDEPRISIDNVTMAEGNTGTTTAVFSVRLSQAYDQPVSVNFSTAEGDTEAWSGWGYYSYYYPPPAATSGSDFQAASGTISFAAGETSKSVTIAVVGDRLAEEDEYFSVNLTGASGNAAFQDSHAVGIIIDDEPRVSVHSTSVTEGNTGTAGAVFSVTLSAASDQAVTVAYSTADGSAAAGSDYAAATGTLTFAPGQTSKAVTVAVTGDTRDEYDEYFFLNLTDSSGAQIQGNSAAATIVDNDPPPSLRISDASIVEGNSGTKLMVFTVSLSAASDQGVWVDYSTANGTAKTSDKDYVATSGSLYFAPGETVMTISVVINGDKKKEKNEYFYVNLFNAVDAVFADAKGLGNIFNDDR